MRQAQKKKEKDKVAIALMLAFCVIALTSIFTIKSNIDKINDSNINVPVSEQTNTGSAEKHLDEADSSKKGLENTKPNSNESSEVSANIPIVDSVGDDTSKDGLNFINPVKSDAAVITNEYSMNSLIYSVTLDQYMTHCGIDIEAPEDSQVVAAAPGTITAVYDDDRYGISIEITHVDGFVTIYSNLSTKEMVEIGDEVVRGKIISGVGSTGLFESLEPSHLHFEMLKDGVYVDPQEYINF